MTAASVALAAAAALASGWAVVRVAGGLAMMRGATPNAGLRATVVGFVAMIAAVLSAHGARWIATVILGAAYLLLVTLYVFVTEANSRIPGDRVVAWWVRLVVPALAAMAAVKLVADAPLAAVQVAMVIAAVLAMCAAGAAAALLAPPPGRAPAKPE